MISATVWEAEKHTVLCYKLNSKTSRVLVLIKLSVYVGIIQVKGHFNTWKNRGCFWPHDTRWQVYTIFNRNGRTEKRRTCPDSSRLQTGSCTHHSHHKPIHCIIFDKNETLELICKLWCNNVIGNFSKMYQTVSA